MINENSSLQNLRTKTNQSGRRCTIEPLLTIKDVCTYLGIGKTSFYKYDLLSKIPHLYVDQHKTVARFKMKDVEKYLSENS